MKNTNKNINAYSLLEMLITLVVFAVLMTMIIQVLILGIESGRQIAARSKVRGDLSEISIMIRRDFRNSSKIIDSFCGDNINLNNIDGTRVVSGTSACFYNLSGINYAWVQGDTGNICPENKLCKFKQNITGDYELFYQSSDILKFNPNLTKFEINLINSGSTNEPTQGVILASLVADISDDVDVEVATQYRQVSVFTRNF